MQVLRFSLVGVANTLIGVFTIFLLMHFGAGDVVANAVGYLVGFIVSFTLNARWTFKIRLLRISHAWRFVLVVAFCYGLNLATMLTLRDLVALGSHVAQLAGVAVYSMSTYVGFRYYVFKTRV